MKLGSFEQRGIIFNVRNALNANQSPIDIPFHHFQTPHSLEKFQPACQLETSCDAQVQ